MGKQDEVQVATDRESVSLNFIYCPSRGCLTISQAASCYQADAKTML